MPFFQIEQIYVAHLCHIIFGNHRRSSEANNKQIFTAINHCLPAINRQFNTCDKTASEAGKTTALPISSGKPSRPLISLKPVALKGAKEVIIHI